MTNDAQINAAENNMKLPRYDQLYFLPEFYTKPWAIQATGTSYRYVNPEQFNVIAINHACDRQPVCIAFLMDTEAVHQINLNDVNCKAFVTRIINQDLFKSFSNVFGVEYNIDVEGKERYYPRREITPSQNSTSMAVKFLGEAGIKTVCMCGIDGGTGKAEGFPDLGENYDRHMKGVRHWAKHYGMKLIRL